MTAISSECVSRLMYGLMTSGASVCPTKMFALTDSDSGPLVPSARRTTYATPRTIHCITPR